MVVTTAVPLHPFEAIVIGSGATGGVAAMTLAEAGVRVLVVEAGPDLSATEALEVNPPTAFAVRRVYSADAIDCRPSIPATGNRILPSTPMNGLSLSDTGGSALPVDAGPAGGGRSLTWGGITLRLSDYEFKAADHDGHGQNWPINHNDLDPHYAALEKLLKVRGDRDGLSHLPDGQLEPALPLMPEEAQFRDALHRERGLTLIHSRGFEAHQPSATAPWPRSSSNGSSLQRALDTGNVEILSNCVAERLELHPGQQRARSVVVVNRATRERQRLDCELVVVCASTIASLRLLLQSEQQNDAQGFIDPSGQLGKGLMDHVSCCRFFSIASQTGRQAMQQRDPSSTSQGQAVSSCPSGMRPSDAPMQPFCVAMASGGRSTASIPPGGSNAIRIAGWVF